MKTDDLIIVPRFSLVVLMGPNTAGKSAFAHRHFPEAAVISSDRCRWMVANDYDAEWASAEAFALLETWVSARLKLGQLTVLDSNALEPRFRLRMLDLAREFHAPAILIASDCRNGQSIKFESEGESHQESIFRQQQRFSRALARVREEGWNRVVSLSPGGFGSAKVEIRPLRVDNATPPPYDLIGDIHGCYRELCELLGRLGYEPDETAGFRHPQHRRAVFVGDMVDRGPDSLGVLRLAMRMSKAGTAIVSPGNHDEKLLRHLTGAKVRIDHGLEKTVAEIEALIPDEKIAFIRDTVPWLRSLPPYLMLDEGRLVVAHAGLPEHFHGRLSRAVTAWALYGAARTYPPQPGYDPNNWVTTYQGRALVVYGHTPSADARMRGRTLCVDQGCVFGGRLTAYRYPENRTIQVQAHATYYPEDAPDLEGASALNNEGGDEEVAGAALLLESREMSMVPDETATVDESHSVEDQGNPGGNGNPAGSLGSFAARFRQTVELRGSSESMLGSNPKHSDATRLESRNENGTLSARPIESSSLALPRTESTGGMAPPSEITSIVPDPSELAPRLSELDRLVDLAKTKGKVADFLPPIKAAEVRLGPFPLPTDAELPDLLPLLEGHGLDTTWLGLVQIEASLVSQSIESMAHQTVDSRWLVYIPPMICPPVPSARPDHLEHPQEALTYFRGSGLPSLVEEALPAARAVIIVGRDDAACKQRFGVYAPGMIYTRLGRPLFAADQLAPMLDKIRTDLELAGTFDRLNARVLIFDAGFRPWHLARVEVVARQFAPAAAAFLASRERAGQALRDAAKRGVNVGASIKWMDQDIATAKRFQQVLGHCAYPTTVERPMRLMPLNLLATERRSLIYQDRLWQLKEMDSWGQKSEMFIRPRWMRLQNAQDERAATAMWEEVSAESSSGIVVRTIAWFPIARGRPELPIMKVRSPNFLKLVYGPQYKSGDSLARLKERSPRNLKTMALREWALASEGLIRFGNNASYAQYHPYVLGVLASQLESSGLGRQ